MAELRLPDGAVYVTGDPEKPAEWDGQTVGGPIVKSSDEKRYTLSLGYPADRPDALRARDGHIDFASADEVEKAAWNYIKNPGVGRVHADGTDGAGEIVESYIYRGPDWQVEGSGFVVKSGDWLIGTRWDEPTWEQIKKGELNGTSMQGTAGRRVPNPADLARIKAAKRA